MSDFLQPLRKLDIWIVFAAALPVPRRFVMARIDAKIATGR